MSIETVIDPTNEQSPVFQSSLPLEAKLERARTELLDLSARNRLLNIPRSGKSVKIIEIVDEQAREIFRLLVRDQKALTFLAGKTARDAEPMEEDDHEIAELAQPEDDGVDARGVANRHADTRLQTRLTPAGLQKRLLDLFYDARTLEEEQGVNILFLALGTLKWVDPNNAANMRYAPLILVPVSLERGNAAEKFKLRWRQEDVSSNLSLEAYLARVHGLTLPPFEAGEEFDPSAYVAAVAEAVSGKVDWCVDENDTVLGFFSFAKFLMYRDLDPETWPAGGKLSEHTLIRPLVSEGFEADDALLDEDAAIDEHIAPAEMVHIVDSDSSQTLAVHEVRKGRNLVIQGPPGTGKSQTIANIIASAVADGKTVLFVAEKMAALEVVKRRLDNTGVGDACLELHSNKANKRALLDELRRTWELGAPKGHDLTTLNARLTEARDQLNAHATRLHDPLGSAEHTPYQVIGHLTRLKQAGQAPSDLSLPTAANWSASDFDALRALLVELAERVVDIGVPGRHVWRGVGLARALPPEVDRLIARIGELCQRLAALDAEDFALAEILDAPRPANLAATQDLRGLAHRVAAAPDLEPAALGADAWRERAKAVDVLLDAGERHAELTERLAHVFQQGAESADPSMARAILARLSADTPMAAFLRAESLAGMIPGLQDEARRLAQALGREEAPLDLHGIDELARLAERVSVAPEADPQAFAADLWDTGVERAADLAAAVGALEAVRAEIGTALSDAAWSADLVSARRTLAAHGTSLLRFLNGEWRAADREVRSYLSDPKTSLARRLALLDALGRGQAALGRVRDDTDFGRSAFGMDWRGDRSSSAPLLALADWMRSLRGLGSEPRAIAGRGPDKRLLGSIAARVQELARDVRVLLAATWTDLHTARDVVFGQATEVDRADLAYATKACKDIRDAHGFYVSVAKVVDQNLGLRRENLDLLAEKRAATGILARDEDLGRSAFGAAWRGPKGDWGFLRASAAWIAGNLDIHELAARVTDRAAVARRGDATVEASEAFVEAVGQLLCDLAVDRAAVTMEGLCDRPRAELGEALAAWRDHGEQLSKWVAYRTRATRAVDCGLGEVVARLHDGGLAPEFALAAFEMSYFEAVFADQVEAVPDLAHFDGDLHGRIVRGFVDLDRQRIQHSALEVVRAHHRRIPPPVGGAVGPLGVLKSEIARKRGHMPIRQLMQKAAPAVQALKPVFMMSPLSVAQFLPPGALTFDLLVMDEASQIQPVDALGAIGRCRQVVVVGDPQQLPPTAFFAKMTGGEAADDEEGAARVADIESILGLFTARGLPTRMLRWHYRSRHQSLIAVSNRQFYENKLYIVPSPFTAQAGLGLKFHHVADGVFETGTTRTNPVEARTVARAIINHAVSSPELSLGVVAFSAAQRRAILDQLELLRRQLPAEHEAYFQAHPAEPFFIKNLENVQGDERDVIFISVGYGPTVLGHKPPMRFGPLGQEGGERRLNVLISRAKRRCEIFSSMTDEDIDPDFASGRKGVFAFRLFLHFARTGRMTLAETTGGDRDEIFEAQVAQALQARGYQVHRDVGVSGIFIGVAVADPRQTDRYLLAVECDGAAYRGARSARDRDRLRQSVLEDHGWFLHRVWSTDWFHRPKEQLERLIAAIEASKVELAARGERQAARRNVTFEIQSIERDTITEMGLATVEAAEPVNVAYVEASLSKPSHLYCELHEAPTGALTALAEQVVLAEGPVHLDEVTARIRDAWGLKRAGTRIQDAVHRAIEIAARQGRVVEAGGFYATPGAWPVVRDRSVAQSPTLRRPDMLPPAEIAVAFVDVVGRNFGATDDQAIQAVSRALGFKATSAQLRDVIAAVLDRLIVDGVLRRRETLIEVGPNAPMRETTTSERPTLERLIAEGEHERLEFKQTLRWDVRQEAVNKKLEDVVVKTIASFANHRGGTLLVGVTDDGEVTGLESDLASLGGSRDKFELHLTNLLNARFSQAFKAGRVQVSFPTKDEKLVCRIDVQRSRSPVYVALPDQSGALTERLVVRSGNASHEIPPSQIAAFVKEHFE
jgi:very-short-patch-repair endonuclease